ncbi:MAG TPA: TIGR01777 family oxidoreductase [Terriglobia bacterium]|nr:TIGR01777 family oxidoreductase [Terriglobia bacterium]
MKIVIPGGSGQVGAVLAREFHAGGHDVTVLSRKARVAPWKVLTWTGDACGDWLRSIEGSDVVINLIGRSVNCRYTPANREEIFNSRVQSTRTLGKAIAGASKPPRVWLQASTATIYAHRYDAANDEFTGILGGNEANVPSAWRFSIDVAKAWEQAANECETPHTRKVLMRSAITLSPDSGGIFDTLLRLVRFGLGGKAGDGRQYVSWIHEADFCRAVHWLIDRDNISGPVNLASPFPVPYIEFQRILRNAWGAPFGLPATRWMVELGARLLRSESELVLKSRRVVPGRLLEDGFRFAYPMWSDAARDLCERWRLSQRPA